MTDSLKKDSVQSEKHALLQDLNKSRLDIENIGIVPNEFCPGS